MFLVTEYFKNITANNINFILYRCNVKNFIDHVIACSTITVDNKINIKNNTEYARNKRASDITIDAQPYNNQHKRREKKEKEIRAYGE